MLFWCAVFLLQRKYNNFSAYFAGLGNFAEYPNLKFFVALPHSQYSILMLQTKWCAYLFYAFTAQGYFCEKAEFYRLYIFLIYHARSFVVPLMSRSQLVHSTMYFNGIFFFTTEQFVCRIVPNIFKESKI